MTMHPLLLLLSLLFAFISNVAPFSHLESPTRQRRWQPLYERRGTLLSATSANNGVVVQAESPGISEAEAAATAADDDDDKNTVGMPYDDNLLYMGISQELDELPKGMSLYKDLHFDLLLDSSDSSSSSDSARNIEIQKLSQRPPLFVLKNVLTTTECQQITDWATTGASSGGGMEVAQTRMGGHDSNQYRQKSQMTWLPNNNTTPQGGGGLHQLATQIQSIFLPYEPKGSLLAGGVEELQVVHYDTTGQYKLHHDGALRILTVLYYLNGVSDTWFPLADYCSCSHDFSDDCNDNNDEISTTPRRMRTRMEALGIADNMTPDQHGVRVSNLQPGDAIAFYSYFQDATFEWNAIHAGLPAKSDKWIATHWYHHVPPSKAEAALAAEAEAAAATIAEQQ